MFALLLPVQTEKLKSILIIFLFQAVQVRLFGPQCSSSRLGLVSGLVPRAPDPVRSRVFRRPAVWLLAPSAAAEALQRHHEAGCVRRARGDAAVAGGHD